MRRHTRNEIAGGMEDRSGLLPDGKMPGHFRDKKSKLPCSQKWYQPILLAVFYSVLLPTWGFLQSYPHCKQNTLG